MIFLMIVLDGGLFLYSNAYNKIEKYNEMAIGIKYRHLNYRARHMPGLIKKDLYAKIIVY